MVGGREMVDLVIEKKKISYSLKNKKEEMKSRGNPAGKSRSKKNNVEKSEETPPA